MAAGGALVQWLWWLLGGSLALAALVVAGWALFSDGWPFVSRARRLSRRRCPKCWYDMGEARPASVEAGGGGDHAALTPRYLCPECGKAVRGVAALQRTRRRWKRLPIAVVLLCLAWQAALIGTPGRQGWQGLVPTAWYLLTVDDFSAVEARPLVERLRAGTVLPWERRWASSKELSLTKIDWNMLVKIREKWPIEYALRVWIHDVRQLQSRFEDRLVHIQCDAEPNRQGECAIPAMNSWSSSLGASSPDWLDIFSVHEGINNFRIHIWVRTQAGIQIYRAVDIRVEIAPTIEGCVTPIDDPTHLNELVGELSAYINSEHQMLVVGPRVCWERIDYTLSSACRLELLRDGEVIAQGDEVDSEYDNSWIQIEHLLDPETCGGTRWLPLDGLVVRITPNYRAAIFDEWSDKCWFGVIELPLRDIPFGFGNGDQQVRLRDCVDRLPMDSEMLDVILSVDADPVE